MIFLALTVKPGCFVLYSVTLNLDLSELLNSLFFPFSVASPDTSVSVFSWQVRAYGQGTPSTYVGVFDINRWYHAQMPDSLR